MSPDDANVRPLTDAEKAEIEPILTDLIDREERFLRSLAIERGDAEPPADPASRERP